MWLVTAGKPKHVGIEEKKKDEADREKVHVEAEEDAGLEEIPSRASHATEGIGAADKSDACGKDEERVCAIVREAGEKIGDSKADKDKNAASQERSLVRIEDAGSHGVSIALRIGHGCFGGILWGGSSRNGRTNENRRRKIWRKVYSPTHRDKTAMGGSPMYL